MIMTASVHQFISRKELVSSFVKLSVALHSAWQPKSHQVTLENSDGFEIQRKW
jgi:hypothetical protein